MEAASKLDTTTEKEAAYFGKKFDWHLGRPPNTHCGVIREIPMPAIKAPIPPPRTQRTPNKLCNTAESDDWQNDPS